MNKSPKEIVREFYESDYYKNAETLKHFLHPECELYWNSSNGFRKLDVNGIADIALESSKSFISLRTVFSHLLEDKNFVTARYTYYVRTIESPEEEMPIAHFVTIWELKDGMLYRGHEISQQADDSPLNLKSFSAIKV